MFWLKKRGFDARLVLLQRAHQRATRACTATFACLLYKDHLINKLSQQRIHDIIGDAVDIEKVFVSKALPVELIGMNSTLMCEYIEFCADRLLVALGVEKMYNVSNPFDWMALISLQGKTNFVSQSSLSLLNKSIN